MGRQDVSLKGSREKERKGRRFLGRKRKLKEERNEVTKVGF